MFDKLKQSIAKAKEDKRAGLDFLPEGYADRRRSRRSMAICLALLVMVIAACGVTFTIGEKKIARDEAEFAVIDAQYTEAAKRIEQVQQMRQKQKTVADRMELTVSLVEKLPRSNLLAEMTNALPGGVSLTECNLDAKQMRAPEPPQSSFDKKKGTPVESAPQPLRFHTVMTVSGVAYTEGQVSDYIDQLGQSGYFESVDLRWVRKGSKVDRNDDTMRTFSIALTIAQHAVARSDDRLGSKLTLRRDRAAEDAFADTNTDPADAD